MQATPPGMRWIPGGRCRMGADLAYPEEAQIPDVEVASFWIDEYAVTNGDFAAFAPIEFGERSLSAQRRV